MSGQSKMWFVDQSKQMFLDFIAEGMQQPSTLTLTDGEQWRSEAGAEAGVVRLVWNAEPSSGEFAPVVLVRKGDCQEFFGWVNTYLGNWRPLSGLSRVLLFEEAHSGPLLSEKRSLRGLEGAALGLVYGELATHLVKARTRYEKSKVTLGACNATCSFAMGRALAVGIPSTEEIVQKWSKVRRIADQPLESWSQKDLLGPLSVLANLKGPCRTHSKTSGISKVVGVCRGLLDDGIIHFDALAGLVKGWPDLRSAFSRMDGPLENRVRVLSDTLTSVSGKRKHIPIEVEFACGLLASQVLPGRFDHVGVLVRYLPSMSNLVLWYGLCVGLTPASTARDFGSILARRILRDMLVEDTIFSTPRCDISIGELDVISASAYSLHELHLGTPGYLVVEISPCVNTQVKWPRRRHRQHEQQRLFEDDIRTVDTLVHDLDNALHKARTGLNALRRPEA